MSAQRTAVITGATSERGIGIEVARRYARAYSPLPLTIVISIRSPGASCDEPLPSVAICSRLMPRDAGTGRA